ncbi:hypothetical protein FJT64_013150 [Amphibalanus amphitrite]|uniref:Helitron helicase-like domain-containing protein n=1 Tax=Amphibalanus amphitrite TaxID=1232801 RepID=A0A6A4V4D9_AMPAM|nr:hypothetical protein FJT64_013150 [Amphibalanus amphitrite]
MPRAGPPTAADRRRAAERMRRLRERRAEERRQAELERRRAQREADEEQRAADADRLRRLREDEDYHEREHQRQQQRQLDEANRERDRDRADRRRRQRRAQSPSREARHVADVLSGELVVPSNTIGDKDRVCQHCGALLWPAERPSLCCAADRAGGAATPGHGGYTPTVVIQGRLYHRLGPLRTRDGEVPKFAQTYVQDPLCEDPEAEAALRLGHVRLGANTPAATQRALRDILQRLQQLLREHNPLVQNFIMASEIPEDQVEHRRLVISADARPVGEHARRYNRPEGLQEVSVLIGEEPVHRDIVLRRRAAGDGADLATISVTGDRSYEPLYFVLLYPFGTDGWHPELAQQRPDGGGPARRVTALQYAAHRLQTRPADDDSLLRACRLLQEFCCMAFARVETQRLLFLAMNQRQIRAELYQHLVDAMAGDLEDAAAAPAAADQPAGDGAGDFQGRRAPLFISESLTTKNQQLYNQLLQVRKSSGGTKVASVFSRRGLVFCRTEKNGPNIRVPDEDALRRIIGGANSELPPRGAARAGQVADARLGRGDRRRGAPDQTFGGRRTTRNGAGSDASVAEGWRSGADGARETSAADRGDVESAQRLVEAAHRKGSTVEEHVVVLSEPGSRYVTHFTPESGRALDLLNELHSVSEQFDGDVRVLGCDGTAVNTGAKGGVCRLFELVTGNPVHWFICQLHGNELNLRHLFLSLDGATSGPRSFSGPIGKACSGDVWEREVVAFEPVPGSTPDLPPDVVQQLSTDQQLLHQLASAVQNGSVDPATARRRIGPLNHARWLTLATRLLRLYMATADPSRALRDLVQFVVCHYVPMWFYIRKNGSCDRGPQNLLRSVALLRELPQRSQTVIQPVIQRNGFWAHPEQILLAMVADEDRAVRERAVRLIRAARQHETEDSCRVFAVPAINFEATVYTELVDWNEPISQPPLLRDLDDAELLDLVDAPMVVPPYPVHTQAVERAVRTVTEACREVMGEEARHGLITAKIRHRQLLPTINSKQDLI